MKIKKQNKPTKAVKAVKKERVIWTVQPEPDVEALVNALCSNAPWGERSRLINEAIREKFAEASAMMQAATEAQEKLAKTCLLYTSPSPRD